MVRLKWSLAARTWLEAVIETCLGLGQTPAGHERSMLSVYAQYRYSIG
jgi:hypothetical protein